MSNKEQPILQVGDLVDCRFHSLRFEGVILEISDGCEKGIPGEVMYKVEIPDQDSVWLKRYEILHKLDPSGAFKDAVHTYTRRQMQLARAKFNTAIAKIVAAKGVERKPWKQ